MSNKLDDLFKDKLERHQSSPRPEAWDVMKGALDSDKRKGYLYLWRIAAIIVLFLGSVFIFYRYQSNQQMATVNPPQDQQPDNKQLDENPIQEDLALIEPLVKEEKLENVAPIQKNDGNDIALTETGNNQSITTSVAENKNALNNEHNRDEQKNVTPNATMIAQNESSIQPVENSSLPLPEKSGGSLVNNSVDDSDNNSVADNSEELTITTEQNSIAAIDLKNSSMDKVEDKLNNELNDNLKNEVPSVVITFIKDQGKKEDTIRIDKKKKFGLKTVIAFASGIKKGEQGIAELRKKKDELLAFSFNKEKNVKNSKK